MSGHYNIYNCSIDVSCACHVIHITKPCMVVKLIIYKVTVKLITRAHACRSLGDTQPVALLPT